mgnify:FL=1
MKAENVKVEKLDNLGRGIARIDNKIVFIENALPEEVVDIEIIKDKKNYSFARRIRLDKKSKYRREICPYSDFCGGCDLISLEYHEQLEYKQNKIGQLVRRNLGEDIKINNIIYDKDFAYRNKILLHIMQEKLGFFEQMTNNIVDIDKCLLVNDRINSLISLIRKFIKNNRELKSVVIRSSSNGDTMLIFSGNVSKELLLKSFSMVDVIVLNNKTVKGQFIKERLGDKEFLIYPNSFFQVNMFNTLNLYNEVKRMTYNKKYGNILDLYCGTGTIGIFLSQIATSVVGIEVVEDAVIAAKSNADINNVENIKFICGRVEDYIDRFNNIDLIILDPPRSGLDKKTIDNVKRINPKEVIYVSCDPMTLVRDLKVLGEDYLIKEITPVDMFPNTHHVECVSVLHRKSLEK